MPTRRTASLLTITEPKQSRGAGQVQSPPRDPVGYRRFDSLCNDNLRNGSAKIVMSGVAAIVTASAGRVVCARGVPDVAICASEIEGFRVEAAPGAAHQVASD